MLTPAKTEVQIVHRPIPADMMECPDCYGAMWLEEPCKGCHDTGSVPAFCLDGEEGCTCHRCEAERAYYKELYGNGVAARDHEGTTYRENMIDAGRGYLLRGDGR